MSEGFPGRFETEAGKRIREASMKERILNYMKQIDDMLENPPEGIDYENEIKKHLVQIGFFMHERLIHLIVTVLFAVMTLAAIFFAVAAPSIGLLLLIVALMCLLVPYIMHYYLLENGVQKMYKQYDEMLRRKEGRQ
jgi:Flp pilus assembly protein TadB